jgi:hypothetical protein
MRFTDVEPAQCRARPTGTLQVFSFKVVAIAEELWWPLHVYGLIAVRDHLDRNRNVIFARPRDNCQTITAEVCSLNFGYSMIYFEHYDLYIRVLVN